MERKRQVPAPSPLSEAHWGRKEDEGDRWMRERNTHIPVSLCLCGLALASINFCSLTEVCQKIYIQIRIMITMIQN